MTLEYATGIAPGATIDFVYVGANATASVFDSLTWAIQNRIAPILNISYGECEPALGQAQFTSLNAMLQQAASQGQTVVSAAGDDGSTDCYGATNDVATEEALAVDFPSSSQYVTGVGGTEFTAAAVANTNSQFFTASRQLGRRHLRALLHPRAGLERRLRVLLLRPALLGRRRRQHLHPRAFLANRRPWHPLRQRLPLRAGHRP